MAQNHSRTQLPHIKSKQALSGARGKEAYEEEKAKKLSQIMNDNLDGVNRNTNSILGDEDAILKGKINENGNLIIDAEVKDAFENAGEILGYHKEHPISIMMKEIGDNYISDGQSAPMGLVMLYQYIKYDADKGEYGGGKRRGEKIGDGLMYISQTLNSLMAIYPKILGDLFGKSLGDSMKQFLFSASVNINDEVENEVLDWARSIDEQIKEEYTRRELGHKEGVKNNEELILEISEGNPGAMSIIMGIVSGTEPDEAGKILSYLLNNNIKGSAIWDLYKRTHGEDMDKLLEYLRTQI